MMNDKAKARDAVYLMLRVLCGGQISAADERCLLAADPGAFIEFATDHQVLGAIAPVLSNHSAARFFGIRSINILAEADANKVRNIAIRHQLLELAQKFAGRNIKKAVLLKGGAFVAGHGSGEVSWRYLTDCDLLIKPGDLDRAVSCAEELGYRTGNALYDRERDHHYPPLWRSPNEAPLELHTRLGPSEAETFLPNQEFRERALWVQEFPGLAIPAPIDRLTHLIGHAQIHSHRYARRQFLLRDALDYYHLLQLPGADAEAVLARFAVAGYSDQCEAFMTFAEQFVAGRTARPAQSQKSEKWAAQSRAASVSRLRQNLYVLRDWLLLGARAVADSERRANFARTLTDPAVRRRRLADLSRYWRMSGGRY